MRMGVGCYSDSIVVFDPEVTVGYGLWVCPECKSKFYGGGRPMHNEGCSKDAEPMYAGLEFHFGMKLVASAKSAAEMFGENHEWYGISVAYLKEHFPELLEAT